MSEPPAHGAPNIAGDGDISIDRSACALSSIVRLADSGGGGSIGALARVIIGEVGLRPLVILDLRLDHTLEEVGAFLGVTRERVRQLEKGAKSHLQEPVWEWAAPFDGTWREKLGFAVSEEELFQGLITKDADLNAQQRLLRIVLRMLIPEAGHPLGFKDSGWWTSNQTRVSRALKGLVANGPLTDLELDSIISSLGVPSGLPVRTALNQKGSPIRFHVGASAWVRSRARHRDAAVAILRSSGEPKSQEELARRLGINEKAVHANLARDHRVRQVRPTGAWILEDWADSHDSESGFQTTIEAVISTLREHGPLTRRQLVHSVTEVYPVSAWAVLNALESEAVGQTESGAWDLSERGAIPRPLRRPAKPASIKESSDGRVISFRRTIDSELQRGSGLPISTYIAWRLDLARPGDKRVFSSAEHQPVTVRRSFGSCSISSLRTQVAELGGQLGESIEIVLDQGSDHYAVTLVGMTDLGPDINRRDKRRTDVG